MFSIPQSGQICFHYDWGGRMRMTNPRTTWSSVPGCGDTEGALLQPTADLFSLPSPGSIPHCEGSHADVCCHASQEIHPSSIETSPSKQWGPRHLSDLGVHTVEAQFFQRKASMSSRSRFRGARQEIPGSQVSGVWFRRAHGFCKGISPRPTDFSARGKG